MCFLKPGNKINKRQGAMNKPTNIVRSGWMIKSPPEQKLQSPLKIFRAKWKKRWFVLHKPSGSLPNQFELSYYSSEECSKKKGSIDLEQCEQIIEDLDSDQYPNLLAIKTFCKGKVRTYYLATDTGEDMGNWVECLCRVCGLKQEDTPTDIPDSRGSTQRMSGNITININMTNNTNTTTPNNNNTNNNNNNNNSTAGSGGGWTDSSSSPLVTSQPVQATPSRPPRSSSSSSVSTAPQPSGSPQSYVHLTDCTSGSLRQPRNYSRADSSDSVPEYEAPQPPPDKKGSHMNHHHHHHHQHHNNNNVDLTKDGHADSVFDIYDRPPPSSSSGGGQFAQEAYDRPRSGTQEIYDRPRSGEFRGSHESIDDELYKVPPNHSNPRPRRDFDDLDAPVPLPRPSPRPSSSHSGGRPMTENYDFPPARPDVVDGCLAPPQRPPKPHGLAMQSPYQNLPSHKSYDSKGGYDGGGGGGNNSGGGFDLASLNAVPSAPSKKTNSAAVLSYDVPRAMADISLPRDLGELEVAPPVPVPRSCGPAAGPSYLNTGLGGSSSSSGSSPPVPPLPETYLKNGEPANLIYADMDATPPPPPPAQCPRRESDLSYADMSRGSVDVTYGNSYMMSRGGGDVNGNPDMVRVVGGAEGGGDVKRGGGGDGGQDLNQVPPVAPRPPLRSATLPQARTSSSSSAAGEIENQVIWSNTRTKSFKRNNLVGMSPTPARPPPLEMRVRPPLPVARGDFASSSEDDEGCYGDGTVKTHHDISVVRMSTVPAAPDFDEPELKYIELAMDTPPDPSRPQAGSYHGTATEYREIDFVKTEALQKITEKKKEDRSK